MTLNFDNIIGHLDLKNYLISGVQKKNIAHAQIFVGKEGTGALAMAMAYAKCLILIDEDEHPSFSKLFEKLQHPDLHFYFPVTTNEKVKSNPMSKLFLGEWREFLLSNPYGSLFDWLQFIGVENKQGIIGVEESKEILKNLSLKNYGGGYSVTIIWHAEKMNEAAANKLLKIIEEPPEKTVFLLITEDEQQILPTIRSRCQVLNFPPYSAEEITTGLTQIEGIDHTAAQKISKQANGNFNKALKLFHQKNNAVEFEEWFVSWVRSAFKAKGNAAAIRDLISWSEHISKIGREHQIKFLKFCLEFFRQSLLLNYGANEAVYISTATGFDLNKFSKFTHGNNIVGINNELNEAIKQIERNGNAKIILLDCSIKLTRLLHQKA
jgi:DNA polymerase-3 subunit delta'